MPAIDHGNRRLALGRAQGLQPLTEARPRHFEAERQIGQQQDAAETDEPAAGIPLHQGHVQVAQAVENIALAQSVIASVAQRLAMAVDAQGTVLAVVAVKDIETIGGRAGRPHRTDCDAGCRCQAIQPGTYGGGVERRRGARYAHVVDIPAKDDQHARRRLKQPQGGEDEAQIAMDQLERHGMTL